MSRYATLLVEVTAGVAVVRLNRPDRRNAFDPAMLDELHRCFADLEGDDDVRAIVVTGVGDVFSAGTDLSGGASALTATDGSAERPEWIRPWTMRTPIIAAMNGPAVGIGLTLPMTWDIRFAAAGARYGFVFNQRGVLPEWGSLWLVPRLVGLSRCFDLLLSGRYFDGWEAAERGLVTAALPADEVLLAALAVAGDIATANPLSVGLTKTLVHEFLAEPVREAAYRREQAAFSWAGHRRGRAGGRGRLPREAATAVDGVEAHTVAGHLRRCPGVHAPYADAPLAGEHDPGDRRGPADDGC
jgi:enoyl-CoA hydratase/carnithine racemase